MSESGILPQKVSDILKRRSQNRERLKLQAPYLYEGFTDMMKHFYETEALDKKHKEMIAVAVAVALRCIPCMANHANNAVQAGATKQEILEAAAIGVEFGGGPSFVVVRDNLLDFLEEIEQDQLSRSAQTGQKVLPLR